MSHEVERTEADTELDVTTEVACDPSDDTCRQQAANGPRENQLEESDDVERAAAAEGRDEDGETAHHDDEAPAAGVGVDLSSIENRMRAFEAIFLTMGEPLSVERLQEITALAPDDVLETCHLYRDQLRERNAGFELCEVQGGYQLRTAPDLSPLLQRIKMSKPKRLSPPALETLAIIAYRQPIVKSDIEKLRGVDATPTLKTLLDRGLIRIVGQQSTAGQPALYGTTDDFLKIFGLKSLEQLPALREFRALEEDPGEEAEESLDDATSPEEVGPPEDAQPAGDAAEAAPEVPGERLGDEYAGEGDTTSESLGAQVERIETDESMSVDPFSLESEEEPAPVQ